MTPFANKAVIIGDSFKIVLNENGFDLVLLDLEMPVITGFEAIKHIKKTDPFLKVIAFTANIPGRQLKDRLLGLGFSNIISKPFKMGDIMKVLKSSLAVDHVDPVQIL